VAAGRLLRTPVRARPAVTASVSLGFVLVLATAAAGSDLTAGPQPGGTGVTPQGWQVTPAGTQTTLGPGTLAVAVSPRGNMVLAVNAGYLRHSLMAIDPATGQVLQTIPEQGGKGGGWWDFSVGHAHGYYVGLAFAPDGRTAYASDGPNGSLHVFQISGSTVDEVQHIKLDDNLGNRGGYPAGIAVSADGSRVYVVENLTGSLYVVDPRARRVLHRIPVGHLPYGVSLNHAGTKAFVTNWGRRTVSVVSLRSNAVVRTVRVGMHPNAIALNPVRHEVYVANSDADSVSVLDDRTGGVVRTIDLRPYVGAPIGASPNALAVAPNGATLYVANAGDDDVAVVRLASSGGANGDEVLGLIPTAWYPSGVALDPDGRTLFVTNMKGLGAGSNLDPKTYWPTLLRGTLSRIPVPNQTTLDAYTQQVWDYDRFGAPAAIPSGSVIPSHPGDPTPITHVIYVMKENRTYDQVLGDLEKGNGDPSFAIFGEDVTPNEHELARRFVTFDNFYADAEVSADGWSWANGAYANTYNQKNWPLDYNGYARPYDFGGFGDNEKAGQPGEAPGRSYLWDDLAAHDVDYRNFGFFVDNPVDLQPSIPGLLGHTDLHYPGWDLKLMDQVRVARWLRVFAGYVVAGSMPTMQFVYLPSDHTFGTTPRARKPSAYVADNDLALGRLVEAVSHSPFWASTAIFVVEDDAQDGPDHVDGHRSIAFAISPYTQTGRVDSTFYSTVSVLRTMELLLGVPPMSQFDRAATPMTAAFSSTPNLRPYDALIPGVSLTATNGPNAPMAKASLSIDFSAPDRIPMGLMNEIIWRSVRGIASEMPRPGEGSASPLLSSFLDR
jgi:YVTN family beta-propeller protein